MTHTEPASDSSNLCKTTQLFEPVNAAENRPHTAEQNMQVADLSFQQLKTQPREE
jgi:hypothetical protein